MTEDEAITIIVAHLKGLFPKSCPNCQHRFDSLSDFFAVTTPMGNPVLHDFEAGELQPEKPLGAVAVSGCACGASVALSSEGMPLFQYWSLLLWAKSETRRRSIPVKALLNHLRTEVRKRVIAEASVREEGLRSS